MDMKNKSTAEIEGEYKEVGNKEQGEYASQAKCSPCRSRFLLFALFSFSRLLLLGTGAHSWTVPRFACKYITHVRVQYYFVICSALLLACVVLFQEKIRY
jgi:hypothetical protein